MKRLNIKLALSLAIGILVLGVGVHFLHAFQVDRNAEGVLEQAQALYEKGEFDEAYQFGMRYLNLRNEDLRGSKMLADIAYDAAELPGATRKTILRAFGEMERAVRLDATDAIRRRKLLDYYVKHGWITSAIDHVKLLRDPNKLDPNLELIAAKCFAVTGAYDESAKICRQLIGYDPIQKTFNEQAPGRDNVEAYAILADLSRERKAGSEAQADLVIEQMVAVNAESTKAHLLAHGYWKRNHQPERAKQSLDLAYQLDPGAPDVVLPMAEQAIEDKKLAEAQALVQAALEEHPEEELLYRAMALIEMRQRNFEKSVQILQQGLQRLPESEVLLRSLVEAQLEKGDLKEAKTVYAKLKESGLSESTYDLFEAQFLMREQKWSQAIVKLNQAKSKVLPNTPLAVHIETLIGKCNQATGDLKTALDTFNSITNRSDGLTDADLGRAQVLVVTGRHAEALKQYEYIAEKLAERTLEIKHVWRPLLQLRAWDQLRLPKDQQDWSKVEALIAELNQAEKLDPISYLALQGELLINKQDFSAARKLYSEALEQHPQNELLWMARLNLELQDGGPDKALKLADKAPAELQGGVVLRLTRASIYSKIEGDPGKAGLLTLEKGMEQLSPNDRFRMLQGLVQEHRQRNDRESAKRLLGVMRGQWKDDLISRHVSFDMAREDGDIQTMRQMAAEIRGIAPADSAYPPVFDAVARITSVTVSQRAKVEADPELKTFKLTNEERAQLREARKLLEGVVEKYAAWNEAHKWLADIYGLENNADGMREQLQIAARKGPVDTRRLRQLYDLLVAEGLHEEAEQIHQQLKGTSIEGTQWSQVAIMIQGKRFDEARKLLDAMAPTGDTAVDELLRHADARRRMNDLPKAEAALQQAVQVDSSSSQAWVMLVSTLVTQNKLSEAQAAISSAELRVPADQRDLVSAQCYEALRDSKRAEASYLKLVAAKPRELAANQAIASFYLRSNKHKEAVKYLDVIDREGAAAQTPADKEIVSWSRRGRAVALASEGTWHRFKQAEALLLASEADVRKQGGEPTPADLLLRISLLTNRSEPSNLRTALALFEELQSRQPLQTNELVNLARLYERVGEWQKTKQIMLGVLGARDPQPLHYLAYAEMLLRNGEYGDVENWLNLYDRTRKDNTSLPIRVTLRVRQNRPQEAVALIKRWIGPFGPKPWPQARLKQIETAAALLQKLHLYADAEKYWRAYAEVDPTRLILLAKCVGLYGDLDEAFSILEASVKHSSPQAALVFGMQILRARKADARENHFQHLGRWYQAALQPQPDNPALEMLLGDIWEIRGELDKAEQGYRKLLQRNNLDPVLRAGLANNLAFILSAQNKNTDEAVELIESAMDVYGPNSDLLDTRGVVYLAAGKPQVALADFKEAVLDPSAMKWVHLALAQNATGDQAGARSSLKKAQDMELKREDLYEVEWTRYEQLARELDMQ
ncbi:MAG: tetratricopeptide repeat protein [Pirellulales bacterium]